MKYRIGNIAWKHVLKSLGHKSALLFHKIDSLSVTRKIIIIVLLIVSILFYNLLPNPLFNVPYATVLLDKDKQFLGAHIAADEQWRFPAITVVPEKYVQCVLTFEDKRFFYHPGFDIFSMARATIQNLKQLKIVSGGSTITMQVIRLMRQNKNRTFGEKIIEVLMAIRLEMGYSKNEILALYASHAPYGGNVVGINAASWRYFGVPSESLSWSECALLAVLPNSPALIHTGRNREFLKQKRDNLLKKLLSRNIIDTLTCELAISEPIVENPKPYEQLAHHLLMRAIKEGKRGQTIVSTIDKKLQQQVQVIVNKHHALLSGNGINNAAVIVVSVQNGEILAYIGNSQAIKNDINENEVDIISSVRSTGSILKPFLYASMLNSGDILPKTLVPDIPMQLSGYYPENYRLGYDGAVPANRALARSLNIPAVKMLMDFGLQRFHYMLNKIGFTSVDKPASHYGLSLILGGCEASLYELTGVYASMARVLNNYHIHSGTYSGTDYFMPEYEASHVSAPFLSDKSSVLGASSIYFTFNAMLDVDRPEDEMNWELFSSSHKVAWKTGTSFGFRDAWAIGLNPDFVVGVWTGNADGEGRPGLIGVQSSAPILFDVFKLLPQKSDWFQVPYDDMIAVDVCDKSGYIAGPNCESFTSTKVPQMGANFLVCPYHKLLHLSENELFQVSTNCENPEKIIHKKWFVLPPAMEWYFKQKNPFYKPLPPYRSDCLEGVTGSQNAPMQIIYPDNSAKIYVPVLLDGNLGAAVFEVIHRNAEARIFWHIDNDFITETVHFHKIKVQPKPGKHTLTIVDQWGERVVRNFEVIPRQQ